MKYFHASWAAVASLAVLSACGGSPASIEDVEAKMTEDFSEGDAEVTWIDVVEDEPGEFTVTLDITDPEEETGSRTAICDVSQTSMSSSYSCQSMRPSVVARVTSEIEDYYSERNIRLDGANLERDDSGDLAGPVQLSDPATGERAEWTCEVDIEEDGFDWRCEAPGNQG